MALCRLLELTPIGTNAFLRFQLEMQLRKLKVNPLKEKARFRRINVAIADAHTNLKLINQSTNCFLMMFFENNGSAVAVGEVFFRPSKTSLNI